MLMQFFFFFLNLIHIDIWKLRFRHYLKVQRGGGGETQKYVTRHYNPDLSSHNALLSCNLKPRSSVFSFGYEQGRKLSVTKYLQSDLALYVEEQQNVVRRLLWYPLYPGTRLICRSVSKHAHGFNDGEKFNIQ